MNKRDDYIAFALWTSFVLFVLSLCFVGFQIEGGSNYSGLGILISGWMGHDFTYVPRLANPLLIFSAVFINSRAYRGASICSTVAFALALTSFLVKSVLIDTSGQMGKVVGYGLGFFLWFAAITLIFITSVVLDYHSFGTYANENGREE